MRDNAPFPQYISRQYRMWVLELDEIIIILIGTVAAIFVQLKLFVVSLGICFFYHNIKSKKPRGYLKHLLFRTGMINIGQQGRYPSVHVKKYEE